MGSSLVKSAERVLQVLEHFRRTRQPASAGEVQKALGLPQSSASMLLRSLVSLGYLDYAPTTRTFMPTLRVALLGDWLYELDPVATPLVETLSALQRATRETVILGRQNGASVQYLSVLQEEYGLQLAAKSGALRPMTLTGAGLILLSAKPSDEARLLIRRNNAEANRAELRVNESELLERLDRFRAQGYSVSQPIVTPGATTIAMLLQLPGGEGPLAVTIGGPTERMAAQFDHHLAALRAHIQALAPVLVEAANPG